MIPETWLPTLTVVTADSVPVAVTVWGMMPMSTVAVRYFGCGLPRPPMAKKRPTPATTTMTAQIAFLPIVTENLTFEGDVPRGWPTRDQRDAGRQRYTQTAAARRRCESRTAARLESAEQKERGRARERGSRDREDPGDAHLAHGLPAHGSPRTVQAGSDDRSRADVRGRDRDRDEGRRPDEERGDDIRRESLRR